MHDLHRRIQLEALYGAHAADVHRYARRRIEDGSAAEDVVADTFLIAWRRLEAVPASDPLPWLYATARRVISNHRRGEARRAALAMRLTAERAVEQAPAGVTEQGDRLLRALAALRPDDREALLLIAWEELTPARAAAALGCSRPALRVRLHRARRRLAAALERERRAEDASHDDGVNERPREIHA